MIKEYKGLFALKIYSTSIPVHFIIKKDNLIETDSAEFVDLVGRIRERYFDDDTIESMELFGCLVDDKYEFHDICITSNGIRSWYSPFQIIEFTQKLNCSDLFARIISINKLEDYEFSVYKWHSRAYIKPLYINFFDEDGNPKKIFLRETI